MMEEQTKDKEKENTKTKEEQKVKIDVMVTLPDGTLTFKTVEVTKNNIQELLNTTKDPIVRYNLEKELKTKKIKF